MKIKNIPFSPPDITDLEIESVVDALKSGWITTGPKTKKLEKEIIKFTGADGCVCLNSQTACAELSLRLLGIGSGDEIITCAYTYTATASVIAHVGANIILVDCLDKDGKLEIDYSAVEKAITDKTKAIIPIDLAGIPCDYEKLFEIVNSKKDLFQPSNEIQKAIGRIAIVTDAAHAFGATYKGEKVGSIADFSNFSFHAVKNFTTSEGGALTWKTIPGIDNDDIYKKLQLFSLHGQNKDALAKTKAGAWEYDVVGTYYKCNMTDIAAAIGLAQMQRYQEMLEKRKNIIKKYDEAFLPMGLLPLKHYTDEYSSSGHLYIIRIPDIEEKTRNEIIEEMAKRGIATNVHYKPLPMHTAYKEFGFNISDYPNAFNRYKNSITLPLYTKLTDDDVVYIISNFKEIIENLC